MIRVTNSQLFKTALGSVMGARVRLQDAQQAALTGQRVSRPSDAPTAAARARLLDSLDTAADSHATNVSYGMARLQSAESALAGVHDQLQRAKEVALVAANGTYGPDERSAAAAEVAQIRDTVLDMMNTQHLGEYVFAHVDTDVPPYDVAASAFSYDVDTFSDVREVDVGPATLAEIGASGSLAFAARVAAPGSVDVPALLADLETALASNDVDSIRTSIDDINTGFSQVLGERTRVGVRIGRLTQAQQAAEQAQTVYTTLRGELVDADAAEAFSRLTLAETTMQAAVTVASRILGPSMLDV